MDLDDLRDDTNDKPKFELWNEEKSKRYNERVKNRGPYKGIIRIVARTEPGIALDLGAGAGVEAEYLIKNGWDVTAVDREIINKSEIESRLDENERRHLHFIQSSFEELKFEKDKYDFVYGMNSFSFCDKDYFLIFLEKISQSLKSGGILYTNVFGPKSDWKNDPRRERMTFLSADEAREIFSKFFFIGEKAITEGILQEKSMFQNIWIRAIKK